MPGIELRQTLEQRGAVVMPAALGNDARDTLRAAIRPETAAGAVRTGAREAYGARGLLSARPELRTLLTELGLDALAEQALGRAAAPIDAQFFDKPSEANWAVPAHQDVVVPVPSGAKTTTVRGMRKRHGLTYGEPPDQVLRELVALRVHFDDAHAGNGGLAIACGSHARGRLSDNQIRQIPGDAFQPHDCRTGDVLLLKPLAVHRSPRSTAPTHRRVLHILYAPRGGWHEQLPRATSA